MRREGMTSTRPGVARGVLVVHLSDGSQVEVVATHPRHQNGVQPFHLLQLLLQLLTQHLCAFLNTR